MCVCSFVFFFFFFFFFVFFFLLLLLLLLLMLFVSKRSTREKSNGEKLPLFSFSLFFLGLMKFDSKNHKKTKTRERESPFRNNHFRTRTEARSS